MKISKFKFFHGVKHYSSIMAQRYMESRDDRTSLNIKFKFFHNNPITPIHNNINVGISNNFISFIDNMTLEQILSVTRGTLSQQQSEYIDCRINHITRQI